MCYERINVLKQKRSSFFVGFSVEFCCSLNHITMCGIVGILGNQSVSQELYDSLIVLQHRGQDSAGVMTYDDHFHLKKGNGLVRDVFDSKNMGRLRGVMGIGHVRYPTAGSSDAAEAQPFYTNSPYGIALIHNGNLTNSSDLKKIMFRHINTRSDSEVLLNIVADEIAYLTNNKVSHKKLTKDILFKALGSAIKKLKGSYSVILMIADFGLVAFRDPYGIRPLAVGKRQNGKLLPEYMIASENVAFSTSNYELLFDVQPGEAVFIDMDRKLHKKQCVPMKRRSHCIFEYVYLARPDSIMDGISVYKTRLRMGKKLASQIRKSGIKIDSVIPVPDTSRASALALAEELGVPYREGLIKNRYIGRTFIMPGQEIRQKSIKYKLNPIELEIRGKNILLVDDSIVRGNTSKKIVEMVKAVGAKKVYLASSAPPIKHPCVYGVDMPSPKEFIADNLSIPEIAKVIGVDKLFYQTLPDLIDSAHEGNKKITTFCSACMDGKYPTGDVSKKTLAAAYVSRELYRRQDAPIEDAVPREDQLSLL